MEKRSVKIVLYGFVFGLMVLGSGIWFLKAQASFDMTATPPNGYFVSYPVTSTDFDFLFRRISDNQTATETLTGIYGNILANIPSFYATGTVPAFTTSTVVSSVGIYLNNIYDPGTPHYLQAVLDCENASSTHWTTSSGISTLDTTVGATRINFIFSPPAPCNTATTTVMHITFTENPATNGAYQLSGENYALWNNTGVCAYDGTNCSTNWNMIIAINTLLVPLGTSNDVPSQNCGTTSWVLLGVDFGKGLCDAVSFLFIPSNDSLQAPGSVWTTLKYKPPFGYFTVYEAEIASSTPTSTPTTSFNVAIPVFLGSIFTPLDVGVAAVIGFLTAWWFYHRGRNIKL